MYPTVYRNIGEEYSLPQITIGAKEKWQPYLGNLSIIIWVRYHTHTRACALNTKTNKAVEEQDLGINEAPRKKFNTVSRLFE